MGRLRQRSVGENGSQAKIDDHEGFGMCLVGLTELICYKLLPYGQLLIRACNHNKVEKKRPALVNRKIIVFQKLPQEELVQIDYPSCLHCTRVSVRMAILITKRNKFDLNRITLTTQNKSFI